MKRKEKMTLPEKIQKSLKKLNGKTIIVACSGGPDSMVLLDMLSTKEQSHDAVGAQHFVPRAEDIQPLRGIKIVVAHIHHGLRASADRDEEIVRIYCEKNDLRFEVLHADVTQEAKKTKTTIEECARNIRKVWLEKIRKKYKADLIATAHHRDDQAETILYRITKGTGITGLVGIEENTKYYLRPLIECSKSEILEYAHKNHILSGHDETNDDTSIPRNLLRHEVMNKLESINPEAGSALVRLSNSARELKMSFDAFFAEALESESFSLDWYHSLPLGFQHEFLRCLYEQQNGSTHGLSTALIGELDRFLSTRTGGKKEIKKLKLQKKQGNVFHNNIS